MILFRDSKLRLDRFVGVLLRILGGVWNRESVERLRWAKRAYPPYRGHRPKKTGPPCGVSSRCQRGLLNERLPNCEIRQTADLLLPVLGLKAAFFLDAFAALQATDSNLNRPNTLL
jgi:hypothetical protein